MRLHRQLLAVASAQCPLNGLHAHELPQLLHDNKDHLHGRRPVTSPFNTNLHLLGGRSNHLQVIFCLATFELSLALLNYGLQ